MTSNTMTLLLLPLMVVAFYFLLIRPQRKRQQQQQRLLSEMQPGERVVTHSGIFGTLISTGDKQSVIQVAPGVELTVLKQAIARVVRPEEEEEESGAVDDDLAEDDVVATDPITPTSPTTGAVGPAGVAGAGAGIAATEPNAGTDAGYDAYRPGEPSSLDLPQNAPQQSGEGIRDVTSSYFDRPDTYFDRPLSTQTPQTGATGATEATRATHPAEGENETATETEAGRPNKDT